MDPTICATDAPRERVYLKEFITGKFGACQEGGVYGDDVVPETPPGLQLGLCLFKFNDSTPQNNEECRLLQPGKRCPRPLVLCNISHWDTKNT